MAGAIPFCHMRTVSFFTVGCKLNQYETQAIWEGLKSIGFERVDFGKRADLCLINTCTVTAQSDYSSRRAIYRAKRSSPEARIVVVGCYAQVGQESLKVLPGVSLVIKNEDKEEILRKILKLFDGRISDENVIPSLGQVLVSGHRNHTRALVKIQDGCNQACSFCIVPQARGEEKSRDLKSILTEVENLHKNGFKEVVLTGVHIGRYGCADKNLCQLMEKILNQTHIQRLRLSSIEPNEITDELINLVAGSNRICRHFHIPLQSGDDGILSAMNRAYSTADYGKLTDKITAGIPDVLIGADVMVGFPGEAQENFQSSVDFVAKSAINYLHVFSYSDRPGTASLKYPDKVPLQIIKQRNKTLRETGYEKWCNFIGSFTGKKLEVLLEKRKDKKTGKLTGLSDNYIRVLVDGKDELANQIVSVEIKGREGRVLVGKIMA